MATYGKDKEFLARHIPVVELSRGSRRILVAPTLQGRVMTSSTDGEDGSSFGWINYDLIRSGELLPHCNNWGGEDRFWLGPEGGQFALFFAPGTSMNFDFEDWQTPSVIDTEGWEETGSGVDHASFRTQASLTNYSGTELKVRMDRRVEVLSDEELEEIAGTGAGLSAVGFRSLNTLTNIGDSSWTKESGAPSIWILGQFNPSADNHTVIPVKESSGDRINDVYFGKIDADRLVEKDGVYYFRVDGKKRGKIGIPCGMTIPTVLALDKVNKVLTIVKFSFDEEARDYVNSLWAYQDEPYRGDVINSYNDGPLEDGTLMGGFYEIESSSKALFLKPGESHTHTSTTIHIKGDLEKLEVILRRMTAY